MFSWIRNLWKMEATKCHYCENNASKTLVWLYDKNRNPSRIKLPWCGCDLMAALRKIWSSPYPVVEGSDYEIESGICPPKKKK